MFDLGRNDYVHEAAWLPRSRTGLCSGPDVFAHNERADCADVQETELRQLLGDYGWPTSISPADVYRTKKDDRGHFK
ncbi:MAG: hypothetical protein DME71_13975 [Verrucomicrobia bacterium]|nr:MAG: hypothetical protein DME71_13975 [Verrucomicrobiota bacterium]